MSCLSRANGTACFEIDTVNYNAAGSSNGNALSPYNLGVYVCIYASRRASQFSRKLLCKSTPYFGYRIEYFITIYICLIYVVRVKPKREASFELSSNGV